MRKMLFIFVLLLVSFSLYGDPDSNCTLVGYCGGAGIGELQVLDNFAYVTCGDYLKIFDVSNPNEPYEISSYNTDGSITDFEVLDTLVYLANWGYPIDKIFQIINVANPTEPELISYLNESEFGPYTERCYGQNIEVVDTFAYFMIDEHGSSNDRLRIVNVSDPTNPFVVAPESYGVGDTSIDDIYVDTLGDNIEVYLSDYRYDHFNWNTSRWKVDNPANPSGPWSSSLCSGGRTITLNTYEGYAGRYYGLFYLACEDAGLIIEGSVHTYGEFEEQFIVYYRYCNASDVYVKDTFAYIADRNDGLRIINVSQPKHADTYKYGDMTLAGYYNIEPGFTGDVYVANNLIYIVADGYLYIIRYTGGSGIKEEDTSDINEYGIKSLYLDKKELQAKIDALKIQTDIQAFDLLGRRVDTFDEGIYFMRIKDKTYKVSVLH